MLTSEYLLRPEVEKKHQRLSAILTTLIMVLLLLLMLFWVFAKPEPEFPEEGILISFGETNTGQGNVEPQQAEEVTPPPPQPQQTEPVEETVETVDDVNATEVDVQEEQPEPQEEPTPEPQPDPVPETPEEPVEEPEPDPQPKYTYNPSGANEDNNSQSQGNTDDGGNMGDPMGGNNNNNMGGVSGDDGSPFSHGLGGRGILSTPSLPKKQRPEQGRASFEVCIDNSGRVTEILGLSRNNQITDTDMLNEARQAIRKLRFTESQRGRQCGEVTLTFTYR